MLISRSQILVFFRECIMVGERDLDQIQDVKTGFFMPYRLKNVFLKTNTEREKKILEDILKFLLGTQAADDLSVSQSHFEVTKASYSEQHDIYIEGQYWATFHTDIASIMKLNWESTALKQWIKRQRKWPSMDDLSDELNQSFIIAKPSFQEKLNPKTTEMRYSFANLERKIAQMQSKTQRLVYLIAKCLLKRWLKSIDPEAISSYLLKNIMLWKCEEYPPWHAFWDASDSSIFKAVRSLFHHLLLSINAGHLPYYFIPTLNILENIPRKTTSQMLKILKNIVKDIIKHQPNNFEHILNVAERGSIIVKKVFGEI